MARWRRVRTPRSFFLMTGGVIAAGLVILAVLVDHALREPTDAWWIGLAFTSLWIAVAVRINRMGVLYNEHGVRSRSVLVTRTMPWDAVAKFADRPARRSPWDWGARLPLRAVWIVRSDGVAIRTPLVYETGRLPSREFSDGARRNQWRWSQGECLVALEQLNRLLDLARRGLTWEIARER